VSRRSPFQVVLTAEERRVLEARVRRRTAEQREVLRAQVVLAAAQGKQNKQIASARASRRTPRPSGASALPGGSGGAG
jgi:hypothetical protein